MEVNKRELFLDLINKLLSSPSKRTYQRIQQEMSNFFKSDYDIVKIIENQKSFDFFPTPEECINKNSYKYRSRHFAT